MLCQICQQAQATIHSLDLTGGEWVQRHVCEKCALGAGPSTLAATSAGKVIKLFGQFFSQSDLKPAATPEGPGTETTCPGCGMSSAQFQQSRRLGCARCYDTFAAELERIFNRVQERTTHRGKVPGRPRDALPSPLELRRLKENLQRAVDEERFEDAAQFRDKIRELSERLGGES